MYGEPDGPLNLAVHAVIADRRGRLLVMHRPGARTYNPNRWELPGGRIAPGEGVRYALMREVRVRTGLDVQPGRLLGAGDQERREDRVVHLILSAAAADGEVELSEEHDAYRWVTPKGLAELPLADWMEAWYGAQTE